jgi:hypothetical protein
MADREPPLPYGDPWSNTVPVPATQPANLPLPVTAPYSSDPVIAQIGEIQVTSTTIMTPAGVFPLKGSEWTVQDQWMAEQKIPSWAIVMAILLFFCVGPFSLLFLLAKETVNSGTVLVTVRSHPYHYVSRVPVNNQAYVQHVYQQVNYVRSLAAL